MRFTCSQLLRLGMAAIILAVCGCTGIEQYVHQGFKVGPNYCGADAEVAERWIDDADVRLLREPRELGHWWTVFQDPTLNRLIESAEQQNLSLREAGFRVLEARAQVLIEEGSLFPQLQTMSGAYHQQARPGWAQDLPDIRQEYLDLLNIDLNSNRFTRQWSYGFNLAWELDFWGRFRRAVAASEATLDAAAANYDDVLVTLLGDVATNYVHVRTLQQRCEFLRTNIDLQRDVVTRTERRVAEGDRRASKLDVRQGRSTLAQTESHLPDLQMELRQAENRLCILLGIPPKDLQDELGPGPIPRVPPTVTVGIPADLLRRRPDVRRAERQVAAQAERIGIATADLYPALGVTGTLAWQARDLSALFDSNSMLGSVGPGFRWDILNYGRLRNNILLQDARFQELLATYQNTVLRANVEVENGLVRLLKAQDRAKLLEESVRNSQEAVVLVHRQYQEGQADFNRVVVIQQSLVQQQDLQAQSQGEIAWGLIQVYRALGGGWDPAAPLAEEIVVPLPEPLPADQAPPEPARGGP